MRKIRPVLIFLAVIACGIYGLFMLSEWSHQYQKNTAAIDHPIDGKIASTPEQPAKAAKCAKVLRNDRSGIWKQYERHGKYVTAEVNPIFYQADFETKEALAGLIVCVETQGRLDSSTIEFIDFLDSRNHKVVATWSNVSGLDVKN